MLMLSAVWSVCMSACYLDPQKYYPGPQLPEKDLALLTQTDYMELRPVFMVVDGDNGDSKEMRIDDLGITVLPGAYQFKARLYHSRLRKDIRIGTMPVVPGESDFPVEQPVLRWGRSDEPYKETDCTELTFQAGFRYGLWCSDHEYIKMKVLGPYK